MSTPRIDTPSSWSARTAPDWLVCPGCQSAVDMDEGAVHCRACVRSWPHRDDIPCLVDGDYYWGPITRDQMREVLRVLETDGWDAAVALLRTRYPNEYRLMFDPSRAAWLSLIDPPSDTLALDLGAGYGGIARWMGTSFREVVAVEANVERTRFASHLYQASGATNVRPLLGNMHRPPLRPAAFDLVAMTGVWEWAAMFGETTDALRAQRELLDQCWALLKPGGQLYLAIENRFAPLFLLGGRDHGRLPWAGLLPYRISKHLVRCFQGWDRQPLTHTRKGLTSLLQQAGFADVSVYHPMPGYHRPMVIAEHDDRWGPPWLLSRLAVPAPVSDIGPTAVACWRILQRFVRVWPFLGLVVPAFMVLARKVKR